MSQGRPYMTRKPVSSQVQANVLRKSRRRCCICFGLNGDTNEKRGQIAHLDQDASNANEDNLAYLCLYHHDAYDSKSSQSKNFTIEEVKGYRTALHEHWTEEHSGTTRRPSPALSQSATPKETSATVEKQPQPPTLNPITPYDLEKKQRALDEVIALLKVREAVAKGGRELSHWRVVYKNAGSGRKDYLENLEKFIGQLRIFIASIEEMRQHNGCYRDIVDLLDHAELDGAISKMRGFLRVAPYAPIDEDPAIAVLGPHVEGLDEACSAYENWRERTLERAKALRGRHCA